MSQSILALKSSNDRCSIFTLILAVSMPIEKACISVRLSVNGLDEPNLTLTEVQGYREIKRSQVSAQ